MKKRILFLTMVSFSALASITENTTKPIALIALKKDNGQYISICKAGESDCKPGTALGFEKEGYGKDYLLIDGQWSDHVLTALITPGAERR